MKRIGLIGAMALLLLQAGLAPAHAQREGRSEGQGKNSQQDGKPDRGQPDKSHPQPGGKANSGQAGGAHSQQGGSANPGQPGGSHSQQGGRAGSGKPGSGGQHVQLPSTPERKSKWQQQQQSSWTAHRAHSFASEHKTWAQRGGYHGFRIPTGYFGSHYGQSHTFHVYDLPFRLAGGSPSFQYGGYWFVFADPYPEYWGDNWYRTDDVYVDYRGDGYYLFDRRFPTRPGVAINISL